MRGTWSGPFHGPLFGLAPDGVFRASALALGAVGSCPTFSPLPAFLAKHRRFKFLWHCPSAGLAAWPPACIPFPPPYVGGYRLRGIAPFGVRTFLPHPARAGRKRSSALPKSKNSLQVIGPRTESKSALCLGNVLIWVITYLTHFAALLTKEDRSGHSLWLTRYEGCRHGLFRVSGHCSGSG